MHPDLFRTAMLYVEQGLGVAPNERVAVVTDVGRSARIAEAFMAALRAVGADAVLLTMYVQRSKEPPAIVRGALDAADVIITPTTLSMTYSDALLEARARGARVMTMPLIGEATYARAGEVDLDEIARLTHALSTQLARAKRLTLTSPLGTALQVELAGHPPEIIDGRCRGRGEYDQIPPGVSSVLAARTEGVMVADASVSQVGTPAVPIRFEIRNSRITKIDGGTEARALARALGAADDANVYHCAAEIGVGTNRWARHVPTGAELSMEGVRCAGWVHVGFGDNHTFSGGEVRATMHNDALLSDCRLEADGVALADAGRLLTENIAVER